MQGASYQLNGYTLRRLIDTDWELLRHMRLLALQNEPGVFGGNFTDEAAQPDAKWQSGLNNPNKAYFGIFDAAGQCIGLTGVFQHKDHPEQVVFVASYIEMDHRGQGLSTLLYQARIDWAKHNGYKKIVVSHRGSNLASKAANQKFGFRHTHTDKKIWPDGLQDDHVFYELPLQDVNP